MAIGRRIKNIKYEATTPASEDFLAIDGNGNGTRKILATNYKQWIVDSMPEVPTKTSQLQNDSGYITSGSVPSKTSQLQNDSGFITISSVPTKTSDLLNDSNFITINSVPTKVSQLQNDSGFVTASDVPTKTSQLQNDSGFITTSVNNLTNYYNKTEVDNKVNGFARNLSYVEATNITTASVKVNNNAYSHFTNETRDSVVFWIEDNDDNVLPNFVIEINNLKACDVTLQWGSEDLKFSAAGGNHMEANKYYQITCVGWCWTMAEFVEEGGGSGSGGSGSGGY